MATDEAGWFRSDGPAVKYISSAPGTRTLTLPCPLRYRSVCRAESQGRREIPGAVGSAAGAETAACRAYVLMRDTSRMTDRNVLGGGLEPCGSDPVTGF